MNWNPLNWLEYAVSWVLVQFHKVTGLIFGESSGWAWAFAIVGLVIVIRILLIPLFVRQIKSQRNMQLLQPKIKEIQAKYAGDRERQSQEMMALYKDTGTNPLSSCLPILAQAPIFFALFQVLQGIAMGQAKGVLTPELVEQAQNAELFGVPIYAYFMGADETPNPTATRILTAVLIILMTITTFLTQRQLIVKNSAKDNPMVQQQKILLYVFPVIFAVTGINFPVGVLIYWLTTNLWSMGQQFYVIRNNPQPDTPAYEAWERREAAKRAKKNGGVDPEAPPPPTVAPPAPRQQPKKQTRSTRQKKQPGQAGQPGQQGQSSTGDTPREPGTPEPEPTA
ncbi:membrane protein insertase YidC [Longivirga aurantiaca]|uniref:Membrane protein insertase YidC n=1 Tax=Longivirga aurantiaca TaxID=1837743 RepID=A0ABW1T6S3_9ACTN